MDQQGKEAQGILNWVKQRKIVTAMLVGFTLIVGIMIGSVISGRVSAMRTLAFAGRARRHCRFPIRYRLPILSRKLSTVWSPRW